eukprot:5742790-Amphidinium_carterae.1
MRQGIVKPQFCAKSFWEPAAFGASGAFVLAAVRPQLQGLDPSWSASRLWGRFGSHVLSEWSSRLSSWAGTQGSSMQYHTGRSQFSEKI